MGELIRIRDPDKALGRLVLPATLELIRPGELIELADQHRNQVLGTLSPIDGLHAAASYARDVAASDATAITDLTEAFLGSGISPTLHGEIQEGVRVHADGEITVAAEGDMPNLPTPEGEPPKFTDDGMMFDPDELGPTPHEPGQEPTERGPRAAGGPGAVAPGPEPGTSAQPPGAIAPPRGGELGRRGEL